MDKYIWKIYTVEGMGLRINVDKTKGMQLLFGKKISVLKVDTCGVCSKSLVVILFSVQSVRGRSIIIALMYLGK